MRTSLALALTLLASVGARAADLGLDGGAGLDFNGRPRRPALAGPPCPVRPARDGAPATITNAPWDPTYVGSPYGLNKPSRDGFVPPLGYDDPYDRLLRGCR